MYILLTDYTKFFIKKTLIAGYAECEVVSVLVNPTATYISLPSNEMYLGSTDVACVPSQVTDIGVYPG